MENKEEEKAQIAANIKAIRKEKGLSQKELAERVGVSSQVISNWERNYTAPTIYDIQKIARELNIGTEQIITGIDTKSVENYIEESILISDFMNGLMKLHGEEFIADLFNNKINIEILFGLNIDLIFKEKVLTNAEKNKIIELINIMYK